MLPTMGEDDKNITPLTRTQDVATLCEALAHDPFVCVDTEFLRETTYWPKLCLIQIAGESGSGVIDPLADGLDLAPFFALMANTGITKVFHAARQDLEIIWNLGGLIPSPVFDTQVAAMVCGYGDAISYDQLVYRITGHQIDKSSRFTDWSRRPLTQKQLFYALSDVTYLRDVYRSIRANLGEQGRSGWVSEEMDILTSPDTYRAEPEDAWKRLKGRIKKTRDIGVMMSVAAWREREAQSRNVPRNRVIKDDAIYEVAMQHPRDRDAIGRLRAVPKGFERSRHADGLIEAVADGLARDPETIPRPRKGEQLPNGSAAVIDLLKVLLRAVSEREGVAARVIATVDDLNQIAASDDADVAALKGWRRTLFGEEALKLKHGKLLLQVKRGAVRTIPAPEE
ncbi:MAG: ribonuclease D [Pseudomonadota bacterium]